MMLLVIIIALQIIDAEPVQFEQTDNAYAQKDRPKYQIKQNKEIKDIHDVMFLLNIKIRGIAAPLILCLFARLYIFRNLCEALQPLYCEAKLRVEDVVTKAVFKAIAIDINSGNVFPLTANDL